VSYVETKNDPGVGLSTNGSRGTNQSFRRIQVKHSVSHTIGKEKAIAATRAAFEAYQAKFEKYDPKAEWVADDKAQISFKAKGVSLSGSIEVKDASVDMDLEVPFLLRAFQGKAMATIEKEIQKWISKAQAGEI
jgi:hypothetical protein